MSFIDKLKQMLGMGGDEDRAAAGLQRPAETPSAQDTAEESASAVDEEQSDEE